jgi:AraC-like DNA-binding protein
MSFRGCHHHRQSVATPPAGCIVSDAAGAALETVTLAATDVVILPPVSRATAVRETMRVEAAQQMLLATSMPIKRIARRCGFGSEETMRRSFRRQFAAAPRDYRERFASTNST